jgi:hypothetical protein
MILSVHLLWVESGGRTEHNDYFVETALKVIKRDQRYREFASKVGSMAIEPEEVQSRGDLGETAANDSNNLSDPTEGDSLGNERTAAGAPAWFAPLDPIIVDAEAVQRLVDPGHGSIGIESSDKEQQRPSTPESITPEQEIADVISRLPRRGEYRVLHVGLEPELGFRFRKLARAQLETKAKGLATFQPDEFRDRLRARIPAIIYDCMRTFDRLMEGVATEGGSTFSSSGPCLPKWIESEITEALQNKLEELVQRRRLPNPNVSEARRLQTPANVPAQTGDAKDSMEAPRAQEPRPAGAASTEAAQPIASNISANLPQTVTLRLPPRLRQTVKTQFAVR